MFCFACGHPVGKHTAECPECGADLSKKPVYAKTSGERNRGARLLLARQEAALMKLSPRGDHETEETFIRRVTEARTRWLDDQVKNMTVRGIHA